MSLGPELVVLPKPPSPPALSKFLPDLERKATDSLSKWPGWWQFFLLPPLLWSHFISGEAETTDLESSSPSPDGAVLALLAPSLGPSHFASSFFRARKATRETEASRARQESQAEMYGAWDPSSARSPHPSARGPEMVDYKLRNLTYYSAQTEQRPREGRTVPQEGAEKGLTLGILTPSLGAPDLQCPDVNI